MLVHSRGDARTVPYDGEAAWDGSSRFGMSVAALQRLGAAHGYTLVYCESHGVNCFLVRDDVLGLTAMREEEPRDAPSACARATAMRRPSAG